MDPQRGLVDAWSAVHDVLAGLLSWACTLLEDEQTWIKESLQEVMVGLLNFDPKDKVDIYIHIYIRIQKFMHTNTHLNILVI